MIAAFVRLPSWARFGLMAVATLALAAVACSPSEGAGGWN